MLVLSNSEDKHEELIFVNHSFDNYEFIGKIRQKIGHKHMGKEELRILMEKIPDSYDDFVNCTVRWMVKDARVQSAILTKLHNNPKSDTSDILEVLCECLGLGEPLELVEDEEDFYAGTVESAPQTGSVVRVAY